MDRIILLAANEAARIADEACRVLRKNIADVEVVGIKDVKLSGSKLLEVFFLHDGLKPELGLTENLVGLIYGHTPLYPRQVKIVVINRRGAVSIKARIVTRADSLVQRRLVNQLVAGVNETAANFRALDKCWLDIENVSVISDNNEERIYLVVPNCNQVGWFEEVRKAAKEAAKHVGVETHITIVQADPGHPEPPDYQE